MAIQLVTPYRKPEEESAMDKIAKGLGIARDIFGIANNVSSINRDMAEATRQDQLKAQQQADEVQKRQELASMNDVSSPESQRAREAYAAYGLQVKPEYSAHYLNTEFGPLSKYAQSAFDEKQRRQTEFAKNSNRLNENPNEVAFKKLPKENQKQIEDLSSKTASKRNIANQLRATYATLKDVSIPYEQRFMAGKNLAKTLNSTEGQDAVGKDERDEMMAFLNHLPVGRPGWDIGPQLDKFADQVGLKIQDIDNAIAANEAQINALYGREGGGQTEFANRQSGGTGKAPKGGLIPEAFASQGKQSKEDLEALNWALKNPNDPRAKEIIRLNR